MLHLINCIDVLLELFGLCNVSVCLGFADTHYRNLLHKKRLKQ